MSKQANPAVIGSFVIGAIALLVTAAMLFGGTELFAERSRLVAYFPSSVKGLRTGANVLFRGVRIGFVEDIQLQGEVESLETQVQVIMRVFSNQYHLTREGQRVDTSKLDVETQQLIDAGLKAQLGMESFVTGQLVVELDFHPDQKIVLRGQNPPYEEIPTIPNNIQQIVENVQRFLADLQQTIDIETVMKNVDGALSGLNELANSEDLRKAIAGLNRVVNADDTQQLSAQLSDTLTDTRAALASVRTLADNADAGIGPLVQRLDDVAAQMDATLGTVETTLHDLDAQIRGDTELAHELVGALDEVQTAARSLRVFLDYLERHPEALLRGKRPE